jgi:MFS family permease
MGLLGSLPYLAAALGYSSGGHFSDRHFSSKRRIPIVVGLIVGGITTHLAAIAPTGEWAIGFDPAFSLRVHVGGRHLYPTARHGTARQSAAFGHQ